MGKSTFWQEVWEVYRGCHLWKGLPCLEDESWREQYSDRLENLAAKLGDIADRHEESQGLDRLKQAQKYVQQMAQAIREYPASQLRPHDLAMGPTTVQIHLSLALEEHQGIKQLPWQTANQLDKLTGGVHQAGEHLRRGKVAEAVQSIDQLIRAARSFRAEIARELDRGPER